MSKDMRKSMDKSSDSMQQSHDSMGRSQEEQEYAPPLFFATKD